MSAKIRLELSQEALASLIRDLSTVKDPSFTELNKIQNKYLHKQSDKSYLSGLAFGHFDLLPGDDEDVMKMIIHAISILTGYPESQISPSSKLADLGLTPTKLDQLRIHINKYISDHGGSTLISSAGMDAFTTVRNVFDATISKLP